MNKEEKQSSGPPPIVIWFIAGALGVLISRCQQHEERLEALEKRAAWFMPEGQQHGEETRR